MALRIQTTPALLSLNVSKATQSIEQPKAQVEGSLSVPKITVESTLPKITIDQVQAFNEVGLKSVEAFSSDYVNYAKQMMSQGMARIASQGDDLAAINKGGNPIPEQARYNSYEQFKHEFGMVTMPTSGPDIEVIEGQIDIRVDEGQLTGKIRAQKPIISYQPGKVNISMQQYNSISIRYIGENLDIKV